MPTDSECDEETNPVTDHRNLTDGRVLRVYRVVVLAILLSVSLKFIFLPVMVSIYLEFPLNLEFFPWAFRDTYVLIFVYVFVVINLVASLVSNSVKSLRVQAIVSSGGVAYLCLHQGTYNDVTYLTSWWASLWCIWYMLRIDDEPKLLMCKATFLSQLIISLVFFGAAAGKWTPSYWSGEVLYETYFVDRDFWWFNSLRTNLSASSLREFATYYSRCVILVETGCSLLWVLPPRIASIISIMVLVGIVIFSNVFLLSVVSCLIGLAAVGLFQGDARIRSCTINL